MVDADGVLPGGGPHSSAPEAWLPSAAGGKVPAERVAEAGSGGPPVDPASSPAPVSTGDFLTELPPGFGDAGGAWVSVLSENPFEVLLVDPRSRVTPEVIDRHRELLLRFWQEKIKSMTQGAARVAILRKYGGEHESERLVKEYPARIERAAKRLSTAEAIEEAHKEILDERRRVAFSAIDGLLKAFLVDGVLHPAEIRTLLGLRETECLPRDEVVAHLHEQIVRAGLTCSTASGSMRLEDRLLSGAWARPPLEAPAAPARASEPVRGSNILPVLLFSGVVALALLIAVAVWAYRMRVDQAIPHEQREPVSKPVEPEKEAPPPAAQSPVEEPVPRRPDPAPTRRQSPTVLTTEPVLKPLGVTEEERSEVSSEIDAIRELAASDLRAAGQRAEQLLLSLETRSPEFAEERIRLTSLRAEIDRATLHQEFADEAARLRKDAEERTARDRMNEWEQRLLQIQTFLDAKNFSGAKTLADQLIAEEGVPDSIAHRAVEMRDQSVRQLQEIFSRSSAKSKTSRRTNRP